MLPVALLGTPELLVVAIIILILFGGSKLPKIGKSLGESIRAFRQALNSQKGDDDMADDDSEAEETED